MGERDSSRTRVAPVFDQLLAADESGGSWLDSVIALGSRVAEIPRVSTGQRLIAEHGRRWGTDECSLPAPRLLLEHLIEHITAAQVSASGDTGDVLLKRQALSRNDENTVNEGLTALRAGKRGKGWFVLEGDSRPDALLETNDLVICIEGKRTERSCTSKTKWMERRSQLVRHMDSAIESFPSKRVLGLLIVEGDGGADAVNPSEWWIAQSAAQYEQTMLNDSLPHRTEYERLHIRSGILGVTTWQAVCEVGGLHWPPATDTV